MNTKADFTNPFFKAVILDILDNYQYTQDNVVYLGKLFKIHALVKWTFKETKGQLPKQRQLEYIFDLVDDIMEERKDIYFDEGTIKILEYRNTRMNQYE